MVRYFHTALIVFVVIDLAYVATSVLDDIVEWQIEIGFEVGCEFLLQIKVVFGEIHGKELCHDQR